MLGLPIGNWDAKFDFSCKAEVSCKITFPQNQLEAELEREKAAEGTRRDRSWMILKVITSHGFWFNHREII